MVTAVFINKPPRPGWGGPAAVSQIADGIFNLSPTLMRVSFRLLAD